MFFDNLTVSYEVTFINACVRAFTKFVGVEIKILRRKIVVEGFVEIFLGLRTQLSDEVFTTLLQLKSLSEFAQS